MLDLRDRYVHPPDEAGRSAVELRAFTHGLMPRTVPDVMAGFVSDWAERGVDAWNRVPDRWRAGRPAGWWSLPEVFGDAFIAPLLGAPEGTCILQPHVHWSISCLLSCDEPFANGRDEIVCTANEFPSVLHTVQHWSGLRPIRPIIVPATPEGFVDHEAVLAAITDRTALVFVSHVGFTSGERLKDGFLKRLASTAQQHGATFVIDGYHAGSTMPIGVGSLGCDVYVGGLLKEASGSSGNSYLYLREDLDLKPRLAGWFGDGDPFGFDEAPTWHPDVRRRFIGGTLSVASHYHAVEGVRILLEAGLDAVRAHSLALTDRAIEHIEAAGLPLRSPREAARRSAMVILEAPHADRLCAWLKTQGVYTDSRKGRYLRLAPFVWNTLDDVDQAFEAIREALQTEAYLAFEPAEEGGPVT